MQIFLIRHPRPLDTAGRCYGRLDVAAEAPEPAARRLGALLPEGIAVLASPLQRARRLAEALHAAPRFDERLMEMDFGAWEGLPWSEIPRAEIDAWAADVFDYAPPGGESLRRMQARAVECVEGVAELAGERVALVTHSGVMRALAGHWLQLPVDAWSQLKFDFAAVSLIETAAGGGPAVLRYLNR